MTASHFHGNHLTQGGRLARTKFRFPMHGYYVPYILNKSKVIQFCSSATDVFSRLLSVSP
jgi:hypothetical protein